MTTNIYLQLSESAKARRERRRNLCIAVCSLSGGVLWLVVAMLLVALAVHHG